jgi:FAD/FMN-containing dehydrogenase
MRGLEAAVLSNHLRRKRTWFLALALVTVLAGCGPVFLVTRAWLSDHHDRLPPSPGNVDDASRMNETRVADIWKIPADPLDAEDQLRRLLAHAHIKKLGVSIAGARHSMGGHTIYPDGVVIDMLPFNHMGLDADKKILRVGAGARWSQLIPYLDARGYSVGIMQSNNDFSVGGSISVNCHGWQCKRPPIADSVDSFRLMKADSTIVTCSRTMNTELFSLALGGYGLFGIILDVELRVVPNERYRPDTEVVPTAKYHARFLEKVHDDAGMVYGRLCVVPGENFLKDAILTVFHKAPCEPMEIPSLSKPTPTTLRREVFRAQIGSLSGKKLRWQAEKTLGENLKAKFVSRNQLLNEGAAVYQEQNQDRTDILHEYFIPAAKIEDFLIKVRAIIPKHPVDLLNVTVRDLKEDKDTFLRYADQDMFALVMLFNQERSAAADEQMRKFTTEMIDAALATSGRYYLPYRLHATPEQFARAYPRAAEFFAKKQQYDPDAIFRNQFWERYGK